MNYSELVAEIQSYAENQFETADINTFIEQAEQRVYNQVQLPAFRKADTLSSVASDEFVSVPNDWKATFSLAVVDDSGNYEYLLPKDVNFIRAAFPNPSYEALPQYYAQYNETTFILGPTPDDAYDLELQYFYYPESIVTAGTTWLGDNFDSVLLYGALLEAYTFMKGEQDVMAAYQKRYDDALAMLKMLGEGKNRGDAYRDGQAKYPVM